MSVVGKAWELIALHPAMAYVAVFILAFLKLIPIVGAVVLGTAVILAIAALVPTGAVDLGPVLTTATISANLSDGAAYWLGRVYHRGLLDWWLLKRCPGLVARSEVYFHRHGAKSLALARFVPGVRAFVPLIAGMVKMAAMLFYGANAASAAIWAVVHVVPGVAVGGYLHSSHTSADPFALPSLAIVGSFSVLMLLGRRVLRQRASTP